MSLVVAAAVAYVLAGQLAQVNTSLTGFVLERLRFIRTLLAQLAASFVTLVTPAAVGGAALNVRYLQRSGVPSAKATASVGAAQVIAFVLHMLLLVIFVAITGAARTHSLRPPVWVYFVLGGLVVLLLLAAMAVPRGRRLLRARLVPTLGHCVRAIGGALPIASIAVVYLMGSALGSAAPTPGGLGAVEVALSAGLTAAGLVSATALSSVLLFRLLTFWLPVPVGWVAFNYLQRKQAL